MGPEQTQVSELTVARNLPLTQRAIALARRRQRDQRRDADGAPFLIHLLEVASYLERSDYPDDVVAAAVLHDVLDDTSASAPELRARFGAECASS